MSDNPFFEQFIEDYFAESEEHLANLRRALLALDERDRTAPASPALFQTIARSLHTIKGLSGMVGLAQAEQLAHTLEDIVRAASAERLPTDDAVMESLFTGAQLIERCVVRRRAREAPMDAAEFAERLAAIRAPIDAAVSVAPEVETNGAAEPAQTAPAAGDGATHDGNVVHFEFTSSRELAARNIGVELIRQRLERLGTILEAKPRVVDGRGIVFDFWVSVPESAQPDPQWASEGLTWTTRTAAANVAAASAPRASVTSIAAERAPIVSGSNVVRVDLDRLDEVMRFVGELVVTRARFDALLPELDRRGQRGGGASLEALRETSALMERQLRSLREGITRIRLVPVGEVFERLRFVARDVAREQHKRVVLDVSGEHTEVDKAIVDRMLEPLMHLVRNAVSHGLEEPNARVAAGKPAEGRLMLRASAVGDRIRVEVEDDGAGIALDRVEERARALGLIADDQTVADALLDVLSAPGFSTRDEADMASGRGVGMAVVRSAVRALGGELSVRTQAGVGTCFVLDLPLTLMIVDALLVEVGGQRMAVPQPALREILPLEPAVVTRFEANTVMPYRGGALPLVSLRAMFAMDGEWAGTSYVLVVGDAHPMGLVVDRLFGIREIVVHPVADPLVATPGIGGATELGDGRVSLILDTTAILRLAAERQEEGARVRQARYGRRSPASTTRPVSYPAR